MLERPGGALPDTASSTTRTSPCRHVQALIAARLDTLAPDRKALLQDAAVVGKVFWAGAVAAMGDRDEDRSARACTSSREGARAPCPDVICRGAGGVRVLARLVRDVAYSQIPRAERGAKHVAAAEWVESMAGERVTGPGRVAGAHHYERALELAKGPQAMRPRERGCKSPALSVPRAGGRPCQISGPPAGRAGTTLSELSDFGPGATSSARPPPS